MARLSITAGLLFLLIVPTSANAQQEGELDALSTQISELYKARRLAAAVPVAERYVEAARKAYGEENEHFASAIEWLGIIYRDQHHFGDATDKAEPLLKRSLAIREKALGPDHLAVATSLDDLAADYLHRGAQAAFVEPLRKRSLAIREAALGLNHPDVATSVNNLADLYADMYSDEMLSHSTEVAALYKRAIAIRETALGPDHPDVATSLDGLAKIQDAHNRDEALSLYQRALAIREKSFGPDSLEVVKSLDNIAKLYLDENRMSEYEPLQARARAIRVKTNDLEGLSEEITRLRDAGKYAEAVALAERKLLVETELYGEDDYYTDTDALTLAALYEKVGRYIDAEPLYQRFLAHEEAKPQNPNEGEDWLFTLADLYLAEGRYDEAEPLYKRIIETHKDLLSARPEHFVPYLDSLGVVYVSEGRLTEAEALFKQAAAPLSPDSPELAIALNHLGQLYQQQGRYAEAEPLFKRSLGIYEHLDWVGPNHPNTGQALRILANLYLADGHPAKARPLLERANAILERAGGPDDLNLAGSLEDTGALFIAQREWRQAVGVLQRAADITIRSTKRDSTIVGRALAGQAESAAARNQSLFVLLLKAADHLKDVEPNRAGDLKSSTFRYAQWPQASKAAASLGQMAAREASGDGALAGLVRQRQDLVAEWQSEDKQLSATLSQPAKEQPVAAKIQQQRGDLARIDKQIAEIDAELEKEFPAYANLSSSDPLDIKDVQALLREDEALILFFDTADVSGPEATFIWAVTKDGSRWVRSSLGTKALRDETDALRCGLDYDGSWQVVGSKCPQLLKTTYSEADHEIGKPLPFDIGKSYNLYQALFGQLEDLITNKHLLIVPSGALTQLPFQVLVTDTSDSMLTGSDAFQRAAWLVRTHSLTVLPSVSSLKALRQVAKGSMASRPLIGFGDPLLDGQPGRYPSDNQRAARARENQSCRKSMQQIALRGEHRGVLPLKKRDGYVDVDDIRMQAPLPETTDELCAVAADLGVGDEGLRLGSHATETEVKHLSDTGELANYRLLYFATHGALAGQLSTTAEPGLLLTPPEKATATDDGYLSAPEIAALKLDADWVVLSACNTAAGGAEGSQALSGMARAFFYAGARSLLVSHWSVYSEATVKLLTSAIGAMAADNSIGRAEAMRRAMLSMIDKGAPEEAHPAYWAPFVVVGEGGSALPVGGQAAALTTEPPSAITGTLSSAAKPSGDNGKAELPGAQPGGLRSPKSDTPSDSAQAASPKRSNVRLKRKASNWLMDLFGQ